MLKILQPLHWLYSNTTRYINESLSPKLRVVYEIILAFISLKIIIYVMEANHTVLNAIIGIITILNYYVLRAYNKHYHESRKRK